MSDFSALIASNMYIVVAALYVLGVFLKKAPMIPDWVIPFVLLVLGAVLGVAIYGGADWAQGLLQGILAAGGAVLVNQLFKQGGDALGIDSGEGKTGTGE